MRKKDALRILKDEIEASLPKDRPHLTLRDQSLFETPMKPSLSLSFKRFAVSMVLLVVAVSSFLLFGGMGSTLTTTTTTSSSSGTTTTSQTATTTTPATTYTTSRDKTPKDATPLIEHLLSADYTPNIGDTLGLDQTDVIQARSRRFREPFLGLDHATETIFTDFDDAPLYRIQFEAQLLFLESKGNEARYYVDQASQIVLLTDTWYHTQNGSFYTYDDAYDSYLIVTWSNDNYVYNRIVTIISARLRLENPEVTIRQDADYLDGSLNHHRDRFYISFLPNWRYTYILDNQDDTNSEGRRNAAAWEIRRDGDVVTASSREESLPSGYVGLRMHQFHPTFATEYYTDFTSSNLLVFTEQGLFLQKFLSTANPQYAMPYSFGLASFGGWTSARIVEEGVNTLEAELVIGETNYLFGNPQAPIPIHPDLVFAAMGPVRDGHDKIVDIHLVFEATDTLSFENVLVFLFSIGLTIDLPGVDTPTMIQIIKDILADGANVFEEFTIRGFDASQQAMLLISQFDSTWVASYLLSQSQIEDILASRRE